MSENLKTGDHVTWKTSQGETEGTVRKTLTHDVKIKSQAIKASEDDPKILVESDKTGAEAAHKAAALKKA